MAEEARHLNPEEPATPLPSQTAHLQAVPSPGPSISERMRERVRVSEIGRAQALADAKGTIWSRFGLLNTLETPLPMTWSLLRRMMSGQSAFGRLHRSLGFEPDPALDETGVLDLICGRPYFNLSRLSRSYMATFPFTHAADEIRSHPAKAEYPVPRLDFRAASPWLWRRLPRTFLTLLGARRRLDRWASSQAEPLAAGVAPLFIAEARRAHGEDLRNLDASALLTRLRSWVRRTVDEFAVEVLKTAAVTAYLTGRLERRLGVDETHTQLMHVHPRAEADVDAVMNRAAYSPWPFESLLEAIGHRAPIDLELGVPRWRESPEKLWQEIERRRTVEPAPRTIVRGAHDEEVECARTWLSLRETSLHWLLHGWDEIRRTLVALDRRLRLDGCVFWLTFEEVQSALDAHVNRDLLDERIDRHRLIEKIECPRVLFSDNLDVIGRG